MAIIVQKYGGSSVATVEKMGLVADKIVAARREGNDVVVVVSAMGKTTDQLLALARQVCESPPRRELDMMLTTGERVSMALLAIAIHARGLESISFTGSQSGIITNDRHFDARIIEVRPHRVEDELARGRIVIIAGYQGMSYRREITTLGRGGSDTTAVAMAAALGAERCEIYSDVDGVYSADPRVVSDARHLPEIGYDELSEMAEAGAKVLNATAVEMARRAGIAIHARSTFASSPSRETRVSAEAPLAAIGSGHASPRRAVVGLKDVALATIDGDAVKLGEMLEHATRLGIAPQLVSLDGAGPAPRSSVVLPLANVPDWGDAKGALGAAFGSALRIDETFGLVTVVGPGVGSDASALAVALSALARAGAPPRVVGTGGLRMSFVIARDRLDDATRALHEDFTR